MPKTTSIIYRNYKKKFNVDELICLKKICKKNNHKLYLTNNLKLALALKLNGVYIPSFNKNFNINNFSLPQGFKLLGSAHNLKEMRIKEKQKINYLFISPIFSSKKNKVPLGIYRFNNIIKLSKEKIVCLGGVNNNNIKKIKLIKVTGAAGISFFKK